MMKYLLMLVLCVISAQSAHAEYFTLSEKPSDLYDDQGFLFPQNLLAAGIAEVTQDPTILEKAHLYLLKFIEHSGRYGQTSEKYNRSKHFGSWIRDHRDDSCMNTRHRVLERDSLTPVQHRSDGCTVVKGKWLDPFGGRTYTSPADIQIDHFVPLKNAYISGASKWDGKTRCLYANFMGNNFNLMAVAGPENNRKSDKTPEGYMPPNGKFRCTYLAQWLKIKMIWGLALSSTEKDSIIDLVSQNQCDTREFSYSAKELRAQRNFIKNNMDLCR